MIVIQIKYCHNHDLHVDIKKYIYIITQKCYIIVLHRRHIFLNLKNMLFKNNLMTIEKFIKE
jgi:hypothetical protein